MKKIIKLPQQFWIMEVSPPIRLRTTYIIHGTHSNYRRLDFMVTSVESVKKVNEALAKRAIRPMGLWRRIKVFLGYNVSWTSPAFHIQQQ